MDKPMARHLPEVKTKIPLMEDSLIDTPLQQTCGRRTGASSPSNRRTPSGEESFVWIRQTEIQENKGWGL
jgi:hypothetical protein